MNFKLIINENQDEDIVVYAKKASRLTENIEALFSEHEADIIGYRDKDFFKIDPQLCDCFFIEGNKLFAYLGKEKLRIKRRLYEIEDVLGKNFVKINQSCIANIKRIEKFRSSVSGSIEVLFKCGYRDYISRRQLKAVKERLGL